MLNIEGLVSIEFVGCINGELKHENLDSHGKEIQKGGVSSVSTNG